jgi:calcium binding protein 39
VLIPFVNSYDNPDIALNTGMILHEMLRDEILAKKLLYSDRLYDFIGYIDRTTFGIACDAQANFKVRSVHTLRQISR